MAMAETPIYQARRNIKHRNYPTERNRNEKTNAQCETNLSLISQSKRRRNPRNKYECISQDEQTESATKHNSTFIASAVAQMNSQVKKATSQQS